MCWLFSFFVISPGILLIFHYSLSFSSSWTNISPVPVGDDMTWWHGSCGHLTESSPIQLEVSISPGNYSQSTEKSGGKAQNRAHCVIRVLNPKFSCDASALSTEPWDPGRKDSGYGEGSWSCGGSVPAAWTPQSSAGSRDRRGSESPFTTPLCRKSD